MATPGAENLPPRRTAEPWTVREKICVVGVVVGTIGMLSTLYASGLQMFAPSDTNLFFLRIVAACWAVIPPLWFQLEWHFYDWVSKDHFEQMKYSHECARAVWAGIGAVAGVVLLTKH